MAYITCRNVSMYYERTRALEDVSFSVEAGDCLFIVGENGSGKSSLLKGILGLHPIKGGQISLGDGLTRQQIGYLPQQSSDQRDFPAKNREVVRSGRLGRSDGFHPFYTRQDKEAAQEAMQKLQILPLEKRSFRELSGGQQQRVLLARALCAAQQLLLLDEPVTGLDPLVTAELYDIVRMLNQKEGMTVVMVSHDIASAVEIANKILHLDRGVAFFGTAEAYQKSEVGRRFLGRCAHCD